MQAASSRELEGAVVRPDIAKHLIPLALFKGTRSLGQIQARWNFVITMMLSGAESLSDGVKLANSPEFTHLCEPVRGLDYGRLRGFFDRMSAHPRVTDNIPGLTRYVKQIRPRPFQYYQVPRESSYGSHAPWRTLAKKPVRLRYKAPDTTRLFYPYVIHKPKNNDGTRELMELVNGAVPKGLPDFIRADICQDLIVGILSGDIDRKELRGETKEYTRKVLEMHPIKYGHLSLDAPIYDGDDRTLADIIGQE